MPNSYTRQRQGRDFSLLGEMNHLRNAELSAEGNYNSIDGILGNAPPKEDYDAKTMREQLEYHKARTYEYNAEPVDGRDPLPERGL